MHINFDVSNINFFHLQRRQSFLPYKSCHLFKNIIPHDMSICNSAKMAAKASCVAPIAQDTLCF